MPEKVLETMTGDRHENRVVSGHPKTTLINGDMRFVPLDKLINLHDGYTRSFKIDHYQLLLLQRDGQRYLVDAKCPHREHPLEAALVSGGVIECAAHHFRFALNDGRLLGSSEEPCKALRTWDLVYEGNEIGFVFEDTSI